MGPGHRVAAKRLRALCVGLALASAQTFAGEVDVLDVAIVPGSNGQGFDIAVTLRHADSGWDHYANRWEVIAPDGEVLAVRTLLHPHVDEQPFTRQLKSVGIPQSMTWIRVRGHDLVHGYGGREVTLSVPHP